jgi:Predicted phosphohydrolases
MKVIQISDIHIMPNESALASKHLANFDRAIDFINANADKINADLIIVTGDISHDGDIPSYERFFKIMNRTSLPFYFFPGNHDNKKNLDDAAHKQGGNYDINSFEDDEWRMLSIDSVVDKEDFGRVSTHALDTLEKAIAASGNKKVAVFLHHHPIPVGTPIVDSCMLNNAEELLSLCQRLNVKFIGSGHAHTLFQRKLGETLISVSPAICSQWKNGTSDVSSIDNSAFSVITFDEHIHVEPWFI